MKNTTVYSMVGIDNLILAVYYSAEAEAWEFRVLSPGGEVFGVNKIFFSPEAAQEAGWSWILAGT